MKYCTQCGHQLIDDANFCNACGAPANIPVNTANDTPADAVAADTVVAVQATNTTLDTENPYAGMAVNTAVQPSEDIVQPVAPVCATATADATYTNPNVKSDEAMRAEEQAFLDKVSLGLKHERLCWKIVGVFYTVCTAIILACSILVLVASLATGESAVINIGGIYTVYGLFYLPIAIINNNMKSKVESYRNKLYIDCKDGVNHFSVGSIVFAAFFNQIALVFIIIYFIQVKSNQAVFERVKATQDAYNSQL